MSKSILTEDTSLMLKAAGGDGIAYNKLYKKYFPILVSYATGLNGYQMSAEDLAQEVFTRVWANKKRFRGDSTVKTYLFGCARNVLREERCRLAKITANQDRFMESRLSYSNTSYEPKEENYPKGAEEILKKAMSELTPKQRQAMNLFYTVGISLTRAAKHCNCSVKTFESRLIRARGRLRQLLGALEL